MTKKKTTKKKAKKEKGRASAPPQKKKMKTPAAKKKGAPGVARPPATFDLLEWKPGHYSLYLTGPGYAWERVASRVAQKLGLAGKVRFDPEAGMFSAQGAQEDLATLKRALEPYLVDPEKFRAVQRAARAEGNT